MDTLRVDDLTQMRLLSKELCKMRKAKDKRNKQGTAKKEAAAPPRPQSGFQANTSSSLQTGVLAGTTQSANIRNRI